MAEYLRYVLKNIEPLRIADDSTSQNGQTVTLRYIPGTTIRGDKELFPSPKGFYEDKTTTVGKKKLENVVVNGELTSGNKRASLGRFCYLDGDCIHYYFIVILKKLKADRNRLLLIFFEKYFLHL